MKYNYTLTIFAIIISFLIFSVAKAQNLDTTINSNANNGINAQENSNSNRYQDDQAVSSANLGILTTLKEKATSTEVKNDRASTTANAQGKLMSETHRSAVATFVKSLLNLVDREGGIGTEVREIAKSQNDSATTTASAIKKVENRGSIRTFFFGSDYKNLGIIRSEITTTSNNIARLKSLLDRTTNNTDRVELNVQIQALESEQIKLDAYVTARENTFSLFGWFTRLFAK